MFTGIVESLGTIKKIEQNEANVTFTIESALSSEIKPEQSLSHNGVCLTVERVQPSTYEVTAIKETLDKTNLGQLSPGDKVNLERSVHTGKLLDGHIVQGHVDTVLECRDITDQQGSFVLRFNLPTAHQSLVVDKGSICLNGVSLTVSALGADWFEVSIIPFTGDHTNLSYIKIGDLVNAEFDIIGKYLLRILKPYLHKKSPL